jgi:hypothetical protein
MKQFLTILVSICLVFSLMACTPTIEIKDYDAKIVSETITETSISIHVVVDKDITKIEALSFIANEIAVATYEKHIEAIALNQMTLIVYIYESNDAYQSNTVTYGHQVFNLNQATKPGLSEGSNNLQLKP